MEVFVFTDSRSAEVYSWLQRDHADFCATLKTRIENEVKDLPDVDDVLDLDDQDEAFVRMIRAIDDLIYEQNPLAGDEGELFSDILTEELNALDYRAIAMAILRDVGVSR